jgi:hypothetical protein
MDDTANVSRIARSLGSFARRAADWVADSLRRSGEGRAAIWESFAQQHQPPSALPLSSQDRSDLQSMKNSGQFGPADLEFAIRRTDDEPGAPGQ